MPLFGGSNPPSVDDLEAKRNVGGLIKALGYQKDGQVRSAAAKALGRTGDPSALGPLVDALKDADVEVRTNVTEALGRIGANAVEPLIATLEDPDDHVRIGAATALRQIGDGRSVDPLIAALKDRDREGGKHSL